MDNIAATSRMARLYIATGFLYFVIGTVLLALSFSNLVAIARDPIFILLLYGFVTQLIFGVSYIFVPGVSRHSGPNYKAIIAEYVLLNVGIIAFEGVALAGQKNIVMVLGGLTVLIIAVLLHATNVWRTMVGGKVKSTP